MTIIDEIVDFIPEVEKVKTIVMFLAKLVQRHVKDVDDEAEPVKFSEENKALTFDELFEIAKESLEEE